MKQSSRSFRSWPWMMPSALALGTMVGGWSASFAPQAEAQTRRAAKLPGPVQPGPLPPAHRFAPVQRRRTPVPNRVTTVDAPVVTTPHSPAGRTLPAQPVARKPVPGKPWMVWNNTTFDFGRKAVSEKVEGDFAFRNDGDSTLSITQVNASCGCTATNYDRAVEPGATGHVRFSIDPNRVHGHTSKTITVQSDCPGHPRTILTAKGEVYRLVDVTPRPNVIFRITDAGETASESVELTANTTVPFEIRSIEGSNETFSAKVEPLEPGKKYRLTIDAKPPYKQGANFARFTLNTTLEQQPTVQVTASAYVSPRVRVSPTILHLFANQTASGEQKRNLNLINVGKTQVDVVEVKVSDPAIRTELLDNPRTASRYVQVTFPANYEPPPTGAQITIRTNDPEYPEFSVPVRMRQGATLARPAARPQTTLPLAPQITRPATRRGGSGE